MSIEPPAPPYVGPPKWHGGDGNKPIRRIVLHGTVSPTVKGGARNIADYFKRTATPSSCHYIVDPGETLQLTYDSWIAYHDGVNVHEIGIEMCDPVAGPITRWDDAGHRAMLKRCARLTAELCLAYDVPVKWRGPIALKAGKRGITDHDKISKAFGKSTHWDLGAFRRHRFMSMVRAEVEAITKPHTGPTRVSKAREIGADLLDLLAAVPKSRKKVHAVASDLEVDLSNLPER